MQLWQGMLYLLRHCCRENDDINIDFFSFVTFYPTILFFKLSNKAKKKSNGLTETKSKTRNNRPSPSVSLAHRDRTTSFLLCTVLEVFRRRQWHIHCQIRIQMRNILQTLVPSFFFLKVHYRWCLEAQPLRQGCQENSIL
jgi:hypothetical protein